MPLKTNGRRDPPDLKRAQTIDKGHGRLETRSIAVRPKLLSWLDKNWPGITAICRIERIRERKNRCTRQVSTPSPACRQTSSIQQACGNCRAITGKSKTASSMCAM
jgi:hypothetical protein